MRLRRVLVVGATTALLTAGLSAPAAATQWDCGFYLGSQGYSGLIVDIGCAEGAQGRPVLCTGSLRIAGGPDPVAAEACRRAALSKSAGNLPPR